MALPLRLRNWLAELILCGLHDPGARQALEALARACDDPAAPGPAPAVLEALPAGLFEACGCRPQLRSDLAAHTRELCARAQRGWQVVRARPLAMADPALGDALDEAAALFDAGLYFEVHEHLEPRWASASGSEREALQGLIQVAVAFQHLANGNVGGALQLLGVGAPKLSGRRLAGIDLDGFARGAEGCRQMICASGQGAPARVDWTAVPLFPRHSPRPVAAGADPQSRAWLGPRRDAMYTSILLAAALQRWERYSLHALAAREVAAALARDARRVHVLTAYELARLPHSGLPPEMVVRLRENDLEQTTSSVTEKMSEYVAPLVAQGLAVSTILRVGNPRQVIVDVAKEVGADLIVIGSHSKRGLLDIALGDTASHVSRHAPCTVVMVSPRK